MCVGLFAPRIHKHESKTCLPDESISAKFESLSFSLFHDFQYHALRAIYETFLVAFEICFVEYLNDDGITLAAFLAFDNCRLKKLASEEEDESSLVGIIC